MKKITIALVNVHGLIRGKRLELGRDADTGGQSRYLIDFAEALSSDERIERVDILTRLVIDKTVSKDYAQEEEVLNPKLSIIRLPFGGNRYLRKEQLWPHLDEAVDNAIKFLKTSGRVPDLVHGHYADGGYVAMHLARVFGLPLVFTAHSLGRLKQSRLLEEGRKAEEIEKIFHFKQRISVEEDILASSDRVITSTQHEIETQYGLYENKDYSSFEVIPPGFDLSRFLPYYDEHDHDSPRYHPARNAQVSLQEELSRFFANPDKPLIISIGRPDKRKNLSGLIEVFGQDKELQAMANLAVFAGIRKDISTMDDAEKDVLIEMLLLMDKYDLYGKLALPKRHDVEHQVPELYRIAARSHGLFVNLALNENFGLTLLEAAAAGCPVVVTNQGGPVDIVKNLADGYVVDPLDTGSVVSAIKKLLVNRDEWQQKSANGAQRVRELYTWQAHIDRYIAALKPTLEKSKPKVFQKAEGEGPAIGKRLGSAAYLFVSDIDGTLIGGDEAAEERLKLALREAKEKMVFAVATGRNIESARKVLAERGFPEPEVFITSVGTEIYYRDKLLTRDKGWSSHIGYQWRVEALQKALEGIEDLELQDELAQRDFKLSYTYSGDEKDILALIHKRLREEKLRYNLVVSMNRYFDFLPMRADKGKAVRYLCYKWGVPYDRAITAGDSGNDEEMLRGNLHGIVVANRADELSHLKAGPSLYLAAEGYAAGVLEGLQHFKAITN
ncbi:HAD-IIB family hydrolase [Treponema sp.]